jgi:hypothetical protein
VREQLRRLLERATKSAIDEEDLGKAMQAAEIAVTIQKVVALYGSVAVEVYAEEESLHKPLDLRRALKDCLGRAGCPRSPTWATSPTRS